MILKSDNERHSYGPDKLVPPARQPASQPARIRQPNNQFFPSENLVKNKKIKIGWGMVWASVVLSKYQSN
ncbi:hypothetical protein DPMN_029982, partial [Dreissena polymorpha]